MLNDIQELIRIRGDLARCYENDNVEIDSKDKEFLNAHNIEEPHGNKDSVIAVLKSVDLQINRLTRLAIDNETAQIVKTLEDLNVDDNVEGNETKFHDMFQEQRGLILEDIIANREQFHRLLKQERDDLLSHKYGNSSQKDSSKENEDVYDLKITNGSSFKAQTKLTQDLKIGNSLGINVGNRLSLNAGTYTSKNLRVTEPDSPRAVNNISVRQGSITTYKDVYSSYTQKMTETTDYAYGDIHSESKKKVSTSESVLDNKYSYTKTDVNLSFSYTGMKMGTNNTMFTLGLEYQSFTIFNGIGLMYFDWSVVQLSMWGYFSIMRILNLGYTKHELYSSGINFIYTSSKNHKVKMLKRFYNKKLTRTEINKNYGTIMKSMRRIVKREFGVEIAEGQIYVENYGEMIAINNTPRPSAPPPPPPPGPLTEKQKLQATYKYVNFQKATIAVYGYASIGGILSGVGALLERYLPRLYKEDEVYQENGGSSGEVSVRNEKEENKVTGYEK